MFSTSIISLALVLAGCSKPTEPPSAELDDRVKAFIHVNLVPMTNETVLADQTVLIEGRTIDSIGPSNEVDIPENAIIIDGKGAYLMPGLADMHIHTKEDWLSADWPVSPLHLYLANGVTTLRDFGPRGDDLTYVLRWRDEIDEGSLMGPTIYASGLRPGHPSAGNRDPQSIVQENSAQGFHFLKIYSYLSRDEYHAVMTTARQLGMYTAGHIPFPVGFDGILTEGMNEIAHIEELDWEFVEFNRDTTLTWQEWLPYLISSIFQQTDILAGFDLGSFQAEYGDTLSKIIRNSSSANIAYCTTLIVDDLIVEKLYDPAAFLARPEIVYLPQGYLQAFQQGMDKHQRIFQGVEDLGTFKYGLDKMLLDELHRAGIVLLLSTDSGTGEMGIVPGFSIHDELRILTGEGLSPYESIATGTINAARVVEAMTGEGDFGTIEVGKRADLILVNENPLNDVANIKNPLGVMAAGRWYSEETLGQMISVDGSGENGNSIITEDSEPVTDMDGNVYKTVKIGNQIWITENLNVAHFRNGDPVLEAKTNEEWEREGIEGKPAWCYFDNDPENGEKYGKLYNWYAVKDPRGLAPEGWHVPTDREWTLLTDSIGGDNTAGTKMKSTSGWNSGGHRDNLSRFTGLPGSGRYPNGYFEPIGNSGIWWSSSKTTTTSAWGRNLQYSTSSVLRGSFKKGTGLSVRVTKKP